MAALCVTGPALGQKDKGRIPESWGTCMSDQESRVSDLLRLPDYIFPVDGLTLGWPAAREVSLRLPLATTVQWNCFDEVELRKTIEVYDPQRALIQPYATQRHEGEFGTAAPYTWSEDKTRQYTKPAREDFGTFIRAKGFCLE